MIQIKLIYQKTLGGAIPDTSTVALNSTISQTASDEPKEVKVIFVPLRLHVVVPDMMSVDDGVSWGNPTTVVPGTHIYQYIDGVVDTSKDLTSEILSSGAQAYLISATDGELSWDVGNIEIIGDGASTINKLIRSLGDSPQYFKYYNYLDFTTEDASELSSTLTGLFQTYADEIGITGVTDMKTAISNLGAAKCMSIMNMISHVNNNGVSDRLERMIAFFRIHGVIFGQWVWHDADFNCCAAVKLYCNYNVGSSSYPGSINYEFELDEKSKEVDQLINSSGTQKLVGSI